jgi:hypothetical protein
MHPVIMAAADVEALGQQNQNKQQASSYSYGECVRMWYTGGQVPFDACQCWPAQAMPAHHPSPPGHDLLAQFQGECAN